MCIIQSHVDMKYGCDRRRRLGKQLANDSAKSACDVETSYETGRARTKTRDPIEHKKVCSIIVLELDNGKLPSTHV